MHEQQKKKDNFVKQAGILALAGIIVRIIGLLYRSPLASIIGDEGNGYYGFAYNIYTIILLISSYSIPSAIAKVMAQRLAFGEYKNAHKLFQCSIIYVVLIGGIASLFTYWAAPLLVVQNAVPVLRIFAPTIFFSGLLGVFRGYFQAHRTMVPTSLSQILEQIMNAAFSLGAAWFFIYLARQAASQGEENLNTIKAIKGASGSALGTGAGVVIALIFILWIFFKKRNEIRREIENDVTGKEESYGRMFQLLILIVTPFILSTFIYNFSTAMNQTIYAKTMIYMKGMAQEEAATLYGIFSGKAVVITNIPIAFSSAMASAMIPGISAAFAKGEKDLTIGKVNIAIKVTMLISIPSMMGLLILSHPVMQLLFPQRTSLDTAAMLLRALSVTVVFYALSTLTNAVLQGIGKAGKPVVHAAIALVVQVIVLLAGLLFFTNSLMALVAAQITYSLLMCLLNAHSVRKCLGYHENYERIYLRPLIASFLMGVIALGIYHTFYYFLHSNALSLLIAILFAIMFYFICIIKVGAVNEKELRAFPNGAQLVRVAKKIHLL